MFSLMEITFHLPSRHDIEVAIHTDRDAHPMSSPVGSHTYSGSLG